MTEEALIAKLPPELPRLAFILGCHRSGTTFLHQTLAETGHYNYVSPFDLINFDQLLEGAAAGTAGAARRSLDAELKAGQVDRGLDGCGVGSEVAEEYGHLLPKVGKFSFFTPSITPETRGRFELLCRKKGLDRLLILKNPDDFYTNVLTLHAYYPDAKMVFIHRHPLTILNSQIQAWLKMVQQPNQYFARLHSFYRHLLGAPKEKAFFLELLKSKLQANSMASQLMQSLAKYSVTVESLPSANWISLRYEDLCQNPDEELRKVSQFLGEPAPTQPLGNLIQVRSIKLLPNVVEAYESQRAQAAGYLEEFGYTKNP